MPDSAHRGDCAGTSGGAGTHRGHSTALCKRPITRKTVAIVPNFTPADIKAMVANKRAKIEKAIIRRLQYLGEKCVNEARDNGDYSDITGNLRGSIGYVVVANGKIVNKDFQSDGGSAGTGKALAEKLAAQIETGFALIVVAGMNYALYVEAKYSKNVLNSAEKLAQRELPRLLAELKKKI